MNQRALPSILVVEDDLDLRQTLVASLEANGFAAAQVSDAADAIGRLRSFAYDGLVVDQEALHTSDFMPGAGRAAASGNVIVKRVPRASGTQRKRPESDLTVAATA